MSLRVPGPWSRVAIAVLLVSVSGCVRGNSREKYNLLLITVDTIRADRIGAYGDAVARTPVMDRMAREGVRFDKAISAVPLTLPSHATILTGLLPPQHGLRNNGAGKLGEKIPTLATTLSSAGYRTGAFVGAFVLDRRFGLHRGFEIYDDDIPAARAEHATLEAERPGSEVVDRALAWLRQADTRPTFTWVHLYDPHAPYVPAEPFRAWFPQDPYRGEIAYVDHQIGRLIEELDRRQLSNRTVVVILGDHGEALGEHGEGTHGLLLYEPTLRVPLILRSPRALESRVVESPVGLVDLAPTLVQLLGISKSQERDLLRPSPDVILYSETEYPTSFGWRGLAAARSGALKFIDAPSPELYDLRKDPNETTNLYGAERRLMRPLAAAVQQIRAAASPQKPARLDPETERKLASLGYVAPAPIADQANEENPVEMVGLFRRFEQAMWNLQGGRAREAIAELEVLVREDTDNPVFRSALARMHRLHGSLPRAIQLYGDAVALRPGDPEAWYNLAAAFQDAGQQQRAAAAVREAIRLDPSRPEAHNILGVAYSAAGKLDQALAEFRRASELDPRNARAFNNLGNVLRSRRNFDEAEAAYRRAGQLDPLYADPWNGLGTIEIERGRPQEAIQFFERALALSPTAHEARLNRAVAYQLAGDVPAAVSAYRDFIRAVGEDPAFAEKRRAAEVMVGRLVSARKRS
jgi:choline-sulfatase